jgi:hypothetical protein
LYNEDISKYVDIKRNNTNTNTFNLKDIQNNAKEMVNNFIKKYEKLDL